MERYAVKKFSVIGSGFCSKTFLNRLTIISVINVKKTLGEKSVLKDIHWTIENGICLALLGASGLFLHLTIEKNLGLMARVQGWQAEQIRARIFVLIDLVKLTPDLLDEFPQLLSGGQQQRVSLVRALMLDPPYLLLDEPL